MKKLFILLALSFLWFCGNSQLIKKIGNQLKKKTEQATEPKQDQPNNNSDQKDPAVTTQQTSQATVDSTPTAPAPLKIYSNYDFVPGDKILFEDNFTDDQDGEFPTHWELIAGQAVLNKIGGEEAFCLTDGNYARVAPRMKTDKYLSDPFTIEFDYYFVPGSYIPLVMLKGFDKELGFARESHVQAGNNEANFSGATGNVALSKSYSEELSTDFENKWHHVAIAIKNHQLKVYMDQYRVLVVPDTKEDYTSLQFAGIGDEKAPLVFKNVRVAAGGNMNMIGKKFTESKIVTHGINFDVNKATLKPESMGTLNMIVQVMKDNPDIKFEVGGHTDGDGTDQYNLKLSQQRADAVKDELVKLGVETSRLTAKGYGESKPIGDNNTPEGKANNRRVEFVKL